jgi:hypothetical protein
MSNATGRCAEYGKEKGCGKCIVDISTTESVGELSAVFVSIIGQSIIGKCTDQYKVEMRDYKAFTPSCKCDGEVPRPDRGFRPPLKGQSFINTKTMYLQLLMDWIMSSQSQSVAQNSCMLDFIGRVRVESDCISKLDLAAEELADAIKEIKDVE